MLRRFGRIDVLVNNAGIAGRAAPTWKQADADWDAVLAVNLTSTGAARRQRGRATY